LYLIEDHLQGTAKKWYQIDEVFKQRDDPQPQILMDRSLQEFKSERTLEAFYDLAAEKQILESYVTCLRRCNTSSTDYKEDYL